MADQGQAEYRKILRERFLAAETETRSDETLLELLLTFAVIRIDTKPLAQKLIKIFGSLSQVLSAAPADLNKIKGLGQASVTLLKMVNFIRSGIESPEKMRPPVKRAVATQQKLFEDPTDHELSKHQTPASSPVNATQRKLQVSNGYLLEFDQLARILHYLLEHRNARKISRKVLQEDTGLADRQVESLISMGSAMGLIKPRLQVLTPTGRLIAEHDIFFEKKGTLEWCHYVGAGSCRNLIWFEIFNRLLHETSPMMQEEWNERIRRDLSGQYSK